LSLVSKYGVFGLKSHPILDAVVLNLLLKFSGMTSFLVLVLIFST
jgi:hypothetical protein